VTLELTDVVVGSQCYIEDINGIELMNETAASSTVQEPYIYTADKDITVRVRKSSGGTEYLPFVAGGTITSSGFSLKVNQIQDTIAS